MPGYRRSNINLPTSTTDRSDLENCASVDLIIYEFACIVSEGYKLITKYYMYKHSVLVVFAKPKMALIRTESDIINHVPRDSLLSKNRDTCLGKYRQVLYCKNKLVDIRRFAEQRTTNTLL